MHSHTHSPAYPSSTDVGQAPPDAAWHYVIISLQPRRTVAAHRYRILEGTVTEEDVTLAPE